MKVLHAKFVNTAKELSREMHIEGENFKPKN